MINRIASHKQKKSVFSYTQIKLPSVLAPCIKAARKYWMKSNCAKFCQLHTNIDIWEEGTSTEKFPPSNWPLAVPIVDFLY